MYRLILFFQRHALFFFFILLESLSFYLVIQKNTYHRAGFINSSNDFVGNIYGSIAETNEYFKLRDINDTLQAENALLRSRILDSYYINFSDTIEVNDTNLHQQFTYIPAKVINNSVTGEDNYITLNKGSRHGVMEKMGVISPSGVVGTVLNVSENFCTVISVLNRKKSLIGGKIGDSYSSGSLVWDGRDPRYALLTYINKHVKVETGQPITTTSESTIFPENVRIGTVDTYVLEDNFYTIKVRLAVDFTNISTVYIVNNLMKGEIDSLERMNNN